MLRQRDALLSSAPLSIRFPRTFSQKTLGLAEYSGRVLKRKSISSSFTHDPLSFRVGWVVWNFLHVSKTEILAGGGAFEHLRFGLVLCGFFP